MAQHKPKEPFQGLEVRSLDELYKLTSEQLARVTSIALPKESLYARNLEQFFKRLSKCSNLTNLELQENYIGPEGAKALAPALAQLVKLQHLNLSHNELGPEGVNALAPVLAKLIQLQYLGLYSNDIGPEGAKALAPVLPQLLKLQHLDLAGNQLGPEGIEALAGVLPFTNITQCPGLDSNAIEKALKENRERLNLQQSILTLVLAGRRLRKPRLPLELWKAIIAKFFLDMKLPEDYVPRQNQPAATPPEQDDKGLNPTNGPGM